MALVVLDASVVIGHLSDRHRHHEGASAALADREGDDLRLPASAYAESLVRAERLGEGEEARGLIAELAIAVDAIGVATAEAAARLRAAHGSLRLPDALVIAHADVLEADELLTTDVRWLDYSRRVSVVR